METTQKNLMCVMDGKIGDAIRRKKIRKIRKEMTEIRKVTGGYDIFYVYGGRFMRKTGTFRGIRGVCSEDPMFEDYFRRWKHEQHGKDLLAWREKQKQKNLTEKKWEQLQCEEESRNGIEFLGRRNQRAPQTIVSVEEEIEQPKITYSHLRFTLEQFNELVAGKENEYEYLKRLGEEQEAALDLSLKKLQEKQNVEEQEKHYSTAIWTKEDWEEYVDYKNHFEENLEKMLKREEEKKKEEKERTSFLQV